MGDVDAFERQRASSGSSRRRDNSNVIAGCICLLIALLCIGGVIAAVVIPLTLASDPTTTHAEKLPAASGDCQCLLFTAYLEHVDETVCPPIGGRRLVTCIDVDDDGECTQGTDKRIRVSTECSVIPPEVYLPYPVAVYQPT